MIIVSITGPLMSDALGQVAASKRYADMFELRLDLIRQPDLVALLSASRVPVIATCRMRKEGGSFRGSERERILLLDLASVLGAEYVDIEFSAGPELFNRYLRRIRRPRVILSAHFVNSVPPAVSTLFRRMDPCGADVLKIAYAAEDATDIRHAVEFTSLAVKGKRKAIAIGMGDAGEASRVLYKKLGGWGTYASAEKGEGSAPGQIKASVLRRLYQADRRTTSTEVYGVIGRPLGQSKGIYLHNPIFQRRGKDAVYCRFPVTDLAGFMRHIAPHLQGFSVTIPHKQTIMHYLDEVDESAAEIGAVNTVVRRRGRLFGTNTDGIGALDAIEGVGRVKGKRILILGAGGAARAIAYEARKRGAEVFVWNRTSKKARALAGELNVQAVSTSGLPRLQFDILANATPVGMTPDTGVSPATGEILSGRIVFDAVYNPPVTKLLRDAASVGATVVQGTEMYINQAARQSELYTGRKPSLRVMKRLLDSGG
jgi:3-dehydroquinate dehydratase/shikimate dehydrogenase